MFLYNRLSRFALREEAEKEVSEERIILNSDAIFDTESVIRRFALQTG